LGRDLAGEIYELDVEVDATVGKLGEVEERGWRREKEGFNGEDNDDNEVEDEDEKE